MTPQSKPDSGEREVRLCETCGAAYQIYPGPVRRWLHGLTAPATDNEARPTTLIIAPAIVLPLSLAQRILAALESEALLLDCSTIDGGDSLRALAAELRERMPR